MNIQAKEHLLYLKEQLQTARAARESLQECQRSMFCVREAIDVYLRRATEHEATCAVNLLDALSQSQPKTVPYDALARIIQRWRDNAGAVKARANLTGSESSVAETLKSCANVLADLLAEHGEA